MAQIVFGESGSRPYGILDVNVQSQSIQGNYSVVYYQLTLVRPSTIYSSAEKSWSCNIGGNVFTGSGSIGGDGDMVLLSGTVTIGHDEDGSKGIYIYGDIGLDITWSGEYIGTIYGEENIGLPTIPRYPSVSQSVASKTETSITINWSSNSIIDYMWYSTDNGSTWTGVDIADSTQGTYTITGLSANTTYNVVTSLRRRESQLWANSSALAVTTIAYPYANSMPDFTIGNQVKIGLYNPLGRQCTVKFYDASNTMLKSTSTNGTSVTFTSSSSFELALYHTIPDSPSGYYTIKVAYSGQTQTNTGGSYEANRTESAPIIGSVTYEDYTYANITQDAQKIVQGKSRVRYTASGLAGKYGASIVFAQVTINRDTYDLTINGDTATVDAGVIDSGTDVDAVFTVFDSRGVISRKTIKVKMLEYFYLSALATIERQNSYYSETDVTIDVNYPSTNGGNSVTISLKGYKEDESTASVQATLSDNVTQVVMFDNEYAWNIRVTITDRFDTTMTYSYHLSRGIPIIYFDRLKSSTGVNCFPQHSRSLEIAGDFYINHHKIENYVIEHTTYTDTYGNWECITYSDNTIDMYAVMEFDSIEFAWSSYASGLNQGMQYFNYPKYQRANKTVTINVQNAIINANVSKCGSNIGWIAEIGKLSDDSFVMTIVRNGDSGAIKVNIHVHGTRVDVEES